MERQESGGALAAGYLCLEFAALDRRLAHADESGCRRAVDEWLERVGLPGPAGGLTAEDLSRARALVGAIDETARALMSSQPPRPEDVRLLNECAHHRTPVFLLRRSGRERVAQEESDAAAAFSVIARDAISLFATADLLRLRSCTGCGLLFYDRSPTGQRRWCSMKRCGERAASALYRQRQAARAAQLLNEQS